MGLDITGDQDKSTAEIRFDGHDRHLADLLPEAIAQAFIARRLQVANSQVERRRMALDLVLTLGAGLSSLATDDVKAEIAKLPEPGSSEETVTITALGLPEKLPRDWIGWLRYDATIEIFRGCFWGLLLTFFSLLYLTRSGEKQRVPVQVFTPWEPEKGSGFGQESSPDPY